MGNTRAANSTSNKVTGRSARVAGRGSGQPLTAKKATSKTEPKAAKSRVPAHTTKSPTAETPEANGTKAVFRDNPSRDRRIIEGMLGDRTALMDEMEAQGFNHAAVMRRAAELGLSEALIRQVRGVAADLAGERPGRKASSTHLGARTCLSCDRVFLSTGLGNRLCMRCRGGDAGLAQL